MANLVLPFLITFLALAVSIGDAVRCYECSSERGDYICGDTFYGQHQVPLIECDNVQRNQNPNQQYYGGNARSVCKKVKTRSPNGQYFVRRTCGFEFGSYGQGGDPCANEYQQYGAECSICRYDACNGAASFAPTYWVLATTATLYFFIKCLN